MKPVAGIKGGYPCTAPSVVGEKNTNHTHNIYNEEGKKIYEDETDKNLYDFDCKLLGQGFYKFKVTQGSKEFKSGSFQVIH